MASGLGTSPGEVAITATNSGTFLVVVGYGTSILRGSGVYRLTLAKTGDVVQITPGDTGGPLSIRDTATTEIDTGDLDDAMAISTAGDAIVVRMGETNDFSANFTPW